MTFDRTEAIVTAILANTKHGVPLSMAERNEGIVRLAAAGWSQRRIARELALSQPRINFILQGDHLGDHPTAVEAIRAPKEYRLPVAEAAAAGGWSQRAGRPSAWVSALARGRRLVGTEGRANPGSDGQDRRWRKRCVIR